MTDAAYDILGPALGGAVRNAFDLMEIAEEEIASYKEKFPDKEDELHGSFMKVVPPDGMEKLTDKVYRHHCQQILNWVAHDRKVGTTDAQVIMALSAMTVQFPVRREFAAAYAILFERIFGFVPGDNSTYLTENDLELGLHAVEEIRSKL